MSMKPPSLSAPADPARIRYLTLAIHLEEGGAPWLLRAAVWIATAMIGFAVAWAAMTTIPQVAQGPGEIVPAGRIQMIQHLEGGIVSKILVQEGEIVEIGQKLAEIDPTAALAERDQIAVRAAGLRLQAERLRAFAEGRSATLDATIEAGLSADQAAILRTQERSRASQRAVLERQLAGRRADLEALLGQQATLQRQIKITGEALDMRQRLTDQGLNSRITLLDVQREMNRVQGELSTVLVNIGRARESIGEAENRLVELDSRLSADAMRELGAVTAELRQVEEARVRLDDRVARTQVVAPVRGVVKELRVRAAGSIIPPGGVILDLVPIGRELIVEARLQPSDIGQVQIGQPVTVKVSSYDFARFGSVPGRLTHLSASTLVDGQGRPYFKAIVALEKDHVGDDPRRNPILPGMTVLADIKTDERTVLRYLLNPVYRALDSAFHEK
ncbi:MAG: HlyD family type I secretion periplasmic adaptor subunit [Rhodospirillales bacterium]|nr:HlyD family type I secretion periplasmic adaptor subunit [Rhodospirillales bacterium]